MQNYIKCTTEEEYKQRVVLLGKKIKEQGKTEECLNNKAWKYMMRFRKVVAAGVETGEITFLSLRRIIQ